MKKTLLTMACALLTLAAAAQSEKIYVDKLVVSVNEEYSEPMDAAVNVTNHGDNTIDFALKNFQLVMASETPEDEALVLSVGNIVIENLALMPAEGGVDEFTYTGNLLITEGDLEGVDFWAGPMLGEIPLVLNGKMNSEKLYVNIDIDMMEGLEQIIHVEFGSDDFATAIRTASAGLKSTAVYDLQGRFLPAGSALKRGLFLVGGRKVAVRD